MTSHIYGRITIAIL